MKSKMINVDDEFPQPRLGTAQARLLELGIN